jgi:hypothetical protein
MADPFDSSHRKLDRSRKHFLDLQRKVSAFIQSSPYHEVVEPHPDKADHEVHKIKPTRALTGELNDIGDDFGEFVINLRSALDNAGYAIAAATGKTDSKYCAFPFAASLSEMVKAVGRCKDLPREIQSLFLGFQPYFGGDDLLCAINAACNMDKHRTVVPAFNVFVRERVSVGGTRFFEMPLEHKWDTAKDEMVLITLGPGSPADFKYDFQFTVFIAINEVPTVQGQPILAVAHAMGCKVESILMAIEAESRRLGIVTT